MDNERRKKLNDTLKKFNKKHKEEIFTMGDEIKELEVVPCGVNKIDDFLGGGFKRGAHTIVWGMYSVGKTALTLMTIANAQKQGLFVCYVNTEKPIEPERFKFFGINLEEMVYIEAPANAEQALEAMRTLCKDKVIDLFIVDSTNGLCPKSVQEEKGGKERALEKKNVASTALMLSNFYNGVNAYVFRSRASVIWIGQARTQGIGTFFTRMGLSGGQAQEFYAYQIIFMRRGQRSDNPQQKFKEYFIDPDGKIRFQTVKEDIGFDAVLKMTKTNNCKSVKEHTEVHVPFLHTKGFVDSIDECDNVPIRIDVEMTNEQVEEIKKYLIEKKPEDAQELGLIETEPQEFPVINQKLQEDINNKIKDDKYTPNESLIIDKPKKKGRGRPKKDKK